MLQNAYLVAKIGADTAENERNFAKHWQLPYGSTSVRSPTRLKAADAGVREAAPRAARGPRRRRRRPFPPGPGRRGSMARALSKISVFDIKICKFLAGSFSAVKEILQENMRLTAFFNFYKICIFLHRCKLKIFAKNRFEKSAIFVKIEQNSAKKFANVAKFAKFCQI